MTLLQYLQHKDRRVQVLLKVTNSLELVRYNYPLIRLKDSIIAFGGQGSELWRSLRAAPGTAPSPEEVLSTDTARLAVTGCTLSMPSIANTVVVEETSLLRRLQALTLPNATPPIGKIQIQIVPMMQF